MTKDSILENIPAYEVADLCLRDRAEDEQSSTRIESTLSPDVCQASVQCRVICQCMSLTFNHCKTEV